MTKKRVAKSLLSLVLVFAMVFSLVPSTAQAAYQKDGNGTWFGLRVCDNQIGCDEEGVWTCELSEGDRDACVTLDNGIDVNYFYFQTEEDALFPVTAEHLVVLKEKNNPGAGNTIADKYDVDETPGLVLEDVEGQDGYIEISGEPGRYTVGYCMGSNSNNIADVTDTISVSLYKPRLEFYSDKDFTEKLGGEKQENGNKCPVFHYSDDTATEFVIYAKYNDKDGVNEDAYTLESMGYYYDVNADDGFHEANKDENGEVTKEIDLTEGTHNSDYQKVELIKEGETITGLKFTLKNISKHPSYWLDFYGNIKNKNTDPVKEDQFWCNLRIQYMEAGLVARMPYKVTREGDIVTEVEIPEDIDEYPYNKNMKQDYNQYDFIEFGLLDGEDVNEMTDISKIKFYYEDGKSADAAAKIESVDFGEKTYFRVVANVGNYILKYEDSSLEYNGSSIRFRQEGDQIEVYEGAFEDVARLSDNSCREKKYTIINGKEDKKFTVFFTRYDEQTYDPNGLILYRDAGDDDREDENAFQPNPENDPDWWLIPSSAEDNIELVKDEANSVGNVDVYTLTVKREFEGNFWIHLGTYVTGLDEEDEEYTEFSSCGFELFGVTPGLLVNDYENDCEYAKEVYGWWEGTHDYEFFVINNDGNRDETIEWDKVTAKLYPEGSNDECEDYTYVEEDEEKTVKRCEHVEDSNFSVNFDGLSAGFYNIVMTDKNNDELGIIRLYIHAWRGWYYPDDISENGMLNDWNTWYVLKADGMTTANQTKAWLDIKEFEEFPGVIFIGDKNDKDLEFTYCLKNAEAGTALPAPKPREIWYDRYYEFGSEILDPIWSSNNKSIELRASLYQMEAQEWVTEPNGWSYEDIEDEEEREKQRKADLAERQERWDAAQKVDSWREYDSERDGAWDDISSDKKREDDGRKEVKYQSARIPQDYGTRIGHLNRKFEYDEYKLSKNECYSGMFITKEEYEVNNWDYDSMLGITSPTYVAYGSSLQEVYNELKAKAANSSYSMDYINISSDVPLEEGDELDLAGRGAQILEVDGDCKGIRLYSNGDNLWPDLTIKGQLADDGRVKISGLWESKGANAAVPNLTLEKTVKADIYPMLGAGIMGGKDYMIQFPEAFENASYKLDDSIAKKDGQKIIVKKNQAYGSEISQGFTICYILPENKVVEPKITGIKVAQNPLKLEYTEGETFDGTNMILTCVYDDGHTEGSISSGYTVDKTGALTVNDKEVTITYGGYSTKLAITVKAKQAEKPAAQDVGTKVEDTSAKGTFEVIKGTSENSEPEVAFKKPEKSEAKVTIPSTVKDANGVEYKVTVIDANAFKNDKKLTKVTIPATVETIGKNAFAGCKKLTTVSLGKGVEKIEQNAFANCTNLKKVEVTKSVTKIGKGAFNGCKKLKTITISSTKITKIESNAFKGIDKKATIKVPKKKLAQYKKLLKKAGFKGTVKGK